MGTSQTAVLAVCLLPALIVALFTLGRSGSTGLAGLSRRAAKRR